MIKSALLLSLAGLSTFAFAAPTKRQGGGKRGLAFNEGALTKLFGSSNGKVSWCYNWDSATQDAAADLMYVPMLHSDDAEHTSKWNDNVDAAVKNGAKYLMSFNEPDQCGGGGACMQDVGRTVAAHKQWVQPLADKYPDVKIGAPAVTNGEKDPVSGTPMGIPFLKAFLEGCDGCKIDYVAAHWYDSANNVEYFKQHLNNVHDASGGKEVWLTEFAPSGDAEGFLKVVLPWLDSQDWITHYSYQWTAPGVLVNDAGNGLTSLGQVYATT